MDYFPVRVRETKIFKRVMGDIAKNGEPYYTCPTPDDIKSLFKDFRIISDRDLPDIEKDYCANTCIIDFAAIIVPEKSLKA